LVVLQREGRLIDFLFEDISGYPDAQVGAAVRQIHRTCREALVETFGVEPVRTENDGTRVRLDADFDPRAVRVVGRLTGAPPFQGTLRHHGWRVSRVKFPARHATLDPAIICPAEFEID
jgi:hypothetical protein